MGRATAKLAIVALLCAKRRQSLPPRVGAEKAAQQSRRRLRPSGRHARTDLLRLGDCGDGLQRSRGCGTGSRAAERADASCFPALAANSVARHHIAMEAMPHPPPPASLSRSWFGSTIAEFLRLDSDT